MESRKVCPLVPMGPALLCPPLSMSLLGSWLGITMSSYLDPASLVWVHPLRGGQICVCVQAFTWPQQVQSDCLWTNKRAFGGLAGEP